MEDDLQEVERSRLNGCVAGGAGTVGAAFLLPEGFGVDLVHDVTNGIQHHRILDGVRPEAVVHVDNRREGRFHLLTEQIRDRSTSGNVVAVNPVGRSFAAGDRSDVFLDKRLQGFQIEIAREGHDGTAGIGEHLAVILFVGGQVRIFDLLHRDERVSFLVFVDILVEILLEDEVRLIFQVRQHGLELVDAVLIFLRVEARIRVVEVHELQRGFKILDGRIPAHAVTQGRQERSYAQVLAREHLADLRTLELGDTGHLVEYGQDVAVERVEVRVRNQAEPAFLLNVEEDLVLFVVRGKHDDLDAVPERPFGRAVEAFFRLHDRGARQSVRIEERFVDHFLFRCLDLDLLHLLGYGEQLLLGGGGDVRLLGSFVDNDEVLVGQALLDDLVDDGRIDLAENRLDHFVFNLGFHVGLVVEEVVDERVYKFRIFPAFRLLGGLFIAGKNILLGAAHLRLGKTVAFHFLDLDHEVLESSENVVFFEGDHAGRGLGGFAQFRDAETAVKIGRVRPGYDVVEPFGHDASQDSFQQIRHETDGGAVVRFRGRFTLPENCYVRSGGLRIRDHADTRLVEGHEGVSLPRRGIFHFGNVAENALDLGLYLVDIDVTDHD